MRSDLKPIFSSRKLNTNKYRHVVSDSRSSKEQLFNEFALSHTESLNSTNSNEIHQIFDEVKF